MTVVLGAAMTAFGRWPERTVRALAEEATAGALNDAGVEAGRVGMVFFGNAASGLIQGQEMIRGQVALARTALAGAPIVNVENACASSSTAFHLACAAVHGGSVDVALAIGVEKMTAEEPGRALAALLGAVDVEAMDELRGELAGYAAAGGRGSLFMDVYARMAEEYAERSGAGPAEFAAVAAKNRSHAVHNPRAQFRTAVTPDEVLAGRSISGMLTLPMCSPIGDGAAAIVVAGDAVARQLRRGAGAVRLRSSVLVSADPTDPRPAVTRAAARLYEDAGLGPEDVDVVELHDATAPAELIAYEELGLCAAGDGPQLLASGATALGGRMPVNPSGGLLGRGHPVGATGAAQLVELIDQLRGRCGPRQVPGARVALAENAGGYLASGPAAVALTMLTSGS